MNRYIYFLAVAFFLLSGMFFYENARFNDNKLHLIVCDIGQGDGIFIRTPKGDDILIDEGPDDSILDCLSNHMPFWDKSIEVMIATHPDADHITGLIYVLKSYNVIHYFTSEVSKDTAVYKRLQDALAEKNLTANYAFSGDRIDFSDKTSLLTVWPDKNSNPGLDTNDFAIVNLLSYGNFKAVLTTDAPFSVEEMVSDKIGKVDVLKVSHHGSKTGASDYFLSKIKPSLAIISVGLKNRYGHPAKEVLDLLTNHNIKYLRTDKSGEVEVVSDGNSFKVYTN